MTNIAKTKRKVVSLTFSRELEYKLLSIPTNHISLTHDVEACAVRGLELLKELEEVTELTHIPQIQMLIEQTNSCSAMQVKEFASWQLSISEDILDEVDLIILTHGPDLKDLGLNNTTVSQVLLLTIVAGLHHPEFTSAKIVSQPAFVSK